jgi:hypothetical protein
VSGTWDVSFGRIIFFDSRAGAESDSGVVFERGLVVGVISARPRYLLDLVLLSLPVEQDLGTFADLARKLVWGRARTLGDRE